MKRLLVLLVAGTLLASACGGGGASKELGSASSLSDPVNRPKAGRYTYLVSGRSVDPSRNGGKPRRLSGVELDEEIGVEGDTVTAKVTSPSSPGVTTTIRTRWTDGAVSLLSTGSVTPSGTSSCTFDPPPRLVPNPVRVTTLPVQKWDHPTCSGSIAVQIVARQGRVPDASGHQWTAWKMEVRTETSSPAGTSIERETRWFSPELGRDIRVQRTADTTRRVAGTPSPAPASVKTRTESETVLQSHP